MYSSVRGWKRKNELESGGFPPTPPLSSALALTEIFSDLALFAHFSLPYPPLQLLFPLLTSREVGSTGIGTSWWWCTAGKATTYGKHATMPVLASDNYAQVILPDITEFQPSELKLDATVVAIGKRRTGKSWVLYLGT